MIDVASIACAALTPGGHLQIGRGGSILHYDAVRRSHGDPDCEALKQAAIKAGLPVIDSRPVSFEIAMRLAVYGPMIAFGLIRDDGPKRDFIVVPLATLSTVYRHVGADVHNVADHPHTARWFADRSTTSLELLIDDWLAHIFCDAVAVSMAAECSSARRFRSRLASRIGDGEHRQE